LIDAKEGGFLRLFLQKLLCDHVEHGAKAGVGDLGRRRRDARLWRSGGLSSDRAWQNGRRRSAEEKVAASWGHEALERTLKNV
jgi:hypothetical protein